MKVKELRHKLAETGLELTPEQTKQALDILKLGREKSHFAISTAINDANLSAEDSHTVAELLFFAKDLQGGRND